MSMLAKIATGGATKKTYVEDVFDAYTFTGTGSSQLLNSGVLMQENGGMTWTKCRSASGPNYIQDTARGMSGKLISESAAAASNSSAYGVAALQSNGLMTAVGDSGVKYVNWRFRKAAKFFDVVTWTGNGADRLIPHSLGVAPGLIIIKCINASNNWVVRHKYNFNNALSQHLNTVDTNITAADYWAADFSSETPKPNEYYFPVGPNAAVNAAGLNYVAYVFAHDPAADGIIQCGAFQANGSGKATVPLGWEPQWIMAKSLSRADYWRVFDVARGMSLGDCNALFPNLSSAESNSFGSYDAQPTATGFTSTHAANDIVIYVAIRRPNKPPTSGTDVFKTLTRGGASTNVIYGIGFKPDVVLTQGRTTNMRGVWEDRLRGAKAVLLGNTDPEYTVTSGAISSFDQDGYTLTGGSNYGLNITGFSYVDMVFRRAPGFFDQVCFAGLNAANQRVNHNLGVTPEMIIVKDRNGTTAWEVYHASLPTSQCQLTNYPFGSGTSGLHNIWGTSPATHNSTTFGIDTFWTGAGAGNNHVAYLFATLPGISKVGSYTGNGSSQTINCGFTAGARFVLVKRADVTGNWYFWDTARGIVAGNEPHLALDSDSAEIATDDSIDPDASGFIVNQVAATNINVASANYIFLSIA